MAEFDILAVFKVEGAAELSASFKRINSAAKNFGSDLAKTGKHAKTFGRNVAIAGGITAAALGKAVFAAKDFESSFTDVVTLLDDSSFSTGTLSDGIAGLRSGVLELRRTSGETFDNLNKGLFDLISAGVDAGDSISSLTTATKLALAGATDTAIAVDGITTALGAFGDEAGTAEQISQKFFTAQKAGKTTIEELSSSVGLVASTASAAGISFEELLAAVSAATLSGIKTNAAFTGMKAAISNIQKPTKVARVEAERLGIGFDQASLGALGFTGVLETATKSANFNDESMIRLFGSVEAVNFVQAVASKKFGEVTQILSDLNNETLIATNFNAALEEKQSTLAFQMSRFGGVIETLSVKIGGALAPAVTKLIDIFTKMLDENGPQVVEFFKQFSNIIISLVGPVSSVVNTLIGLFNVLSSILNVIPGVNGAAAAFTIVFLQLTGGLRLGLSLLKLTASAIKLLEAVMISAGVVSKAGFLAPFATSMKAVAASALATSRKVVAQLLVIGSSMTTLTGIMNLAGIAAKVFWAFLTGPIGLALLVGTVIADFIAKFFGFKGIIDAVSQSFTFLLDKVKAVFKAVTDFFGGGEKELKVKVSGDADVDPTGRQGFAGGGYISGSGTSTSDSIPIMASDSEYMINARSVKKFGVGLFDMLNRGTLPAIQGFATGGLVEALSSSSRINTSSLSPSLATASSSPSGRPLNLILPSGEVIKATTDESTAERLQKNLRRSDSVKSSQLPAWY